MRQSHCSVLLARFCQKDWKNREGGVESFAKGFTDPPSENHWSSWYATSLTGLCLVPRWSPLWNASFAFLLCWETTPLVSLSSPLTVVVVGTPQQCPFYTASGCRCFQGHLLIIRWSSSNSIHANAFDWLVNRHLFCAYYNLLVYTPSPS